MKIGLKLYSTNTDLIQEAQRVKERNIYDYIELYVYPNSCSDTLQRWKDVDVPFVIHAAHSLHGINLAQADKWEPNRKNFNEARRFADALSSEIIILHPGSNGSLDETIRQLRLLNEERIALENKPKVGMHNEICVGWSLLEFSRAVKEGGVHTVALDFGHAVCAARSSGVDPMEMIKEFMGLKPNIFHLSDGDVTSEKDVHLNLGQGSFNLGGFVSLIPRNSFVTIETPRNKSTGLRDFEKDVTFLRPILP